MRGIRFDALLKNISSFAAILTAQSADAAAGPRPTMASARAQATGSVNTPDVNGGFMADKSAWSPRALAGSASSGPSDRSWPTSCIPTRSAVSAEGSCIAFALLLGSRA